MVRVDAVLEILGERSLDARVLELPDLEGVEPEVVLAVGAVPVLLLAVLEVGLAVVPESDLVDVAHVAGGGGALDCLDEIIVGRHAFGQVVDNVVWVILEACCIRLHGSRQYGKEVENDSPPSRVCTWRQTRLS